MGGFDPDFPSAAGGTGNDVAVSGGTRIGQRGTAWFKTREMSLGEQISLRLILDVGVGRIS